MELVERLHQRLQGAGADPSVQGHRQAGGVSAGGPASVAPTGNTTVRSRRRAASLGPLQEGAKLAGPYAFGGGLGPSHD